MKIPVETKPTLWGVAGGAVLLTIVGFTWGGWVTGGKAEADATQRANAAVVVALAPVCVEKFQHTADASANLVINDQSNLSSFDHRRRSSDERPTD